MDRSKFISLVVRREYSEHKLEYIGVEEEVIVEHLSSKTFSETAPARLKQQVISAMYEYLSYHRFIEDEKTKTLSPFENKVRLYIKNEIREVYRKQIKAGIITELDAVIRVKRGLSYLLTNYLFECLYDQFRSTTILFKTPAELKAFFLEHTLKIFPVQFDFFLARLNQEDWDYWDRMALFIKQLSNNFVQNKVWNAKTQKQARNELPGDVYLLLRKRIVDEKKHFNTPKHLVGHIATICKFKLLEFFRKNDEWNDEIMLKEDEIEQSLEDENIFEGNEIEQSLEDENVLEVDVHNPYEVKRLLVQVLFNKQHPLYNSLVGDKQEQVDLLIAVNGYELSYDEIINERYDARQLSPTEHRRIYDRLRQENGRIQKYLYKRFETILEENESMYTY